MENLLLSASIILILTGITHSVLGELLIFKKIRNKGIVPNIEIPPLQIRNFQIIWATWHLVSVFGILIAVLIIQIAKSSPATSEFLIPISASMLVGSLLVLFATKAKHPGWFGLMMVALLCLLSLKS